MGDVRFTQAQIRGLLGLEPETMRHWRQRLGPLGAKPRKAAYDRADLLALAVVRELVRGVGVTVSVLTPVADRIFDLCRSHSWPYLSRCRLRLESSCVSLEQADATAAAISNCSAVMVPLAPIIMQLGQALLGEDGEVQRELRFPLTVQPGKRA